MKRKTVRPTFNAKQSDCYSQMHKRFVLPEDNFILNQFDSHTFRFTEFPPTIHLFPIHRKIINLASVSFAFRILIG